MFPKLVAFLLMLLGCHATGICAVLDDGFLKRNGAEFILDGKPFYEISFNKFDLVLEMLGAQIGSKEYGEDPVANAVNALRNLHAYGFKTIRAFAFCHKGSIFFDPKGKADYFAALDKTLDLCDRYDIRVVLCLNAADMYCWKSQGETLSDLVGDSQSKSRRLSESMVREIVGRYKNRKTIAAWENENELLYKADSGDAQRKVANLVVPSFGEVVRWHAAMAALIRSIDSRHLVTTGDSFRESLWHQWQHGLGLQKNKWEKDTPAQLMAAVSLAQDGVDLFSIHDYLNIDHLEPRICSAEDWVRVAHAMGKPLYYGEYGSLPMAKNEKTASIWAKNPGWFASYEGEEEPKAEQVFAEGLDRFLAARPNLVHWWTYQTDIVAFQYPSRMDVSLERTPRLFKKIVDANRQLQLSTMGFTYVRDPNENSKTAKRQ